MCWFLKMRLTRRKKAAEQKTQSLKNTMVQSFNRLSSSMSAIMGGHGSSAGTAGPRGTRRGTIRGTARGGGKMAGRGAGRGTGKRLSRAYSGGVNTPLINPKGIPNMSRSVHNNPAKVKRKYQKQKKAGNRGAPLPPEQTSTLPTLCKFFQKPQRQQGASLPSKNFRKHYMCHSWEGGVVQLNALDDIEEEDEEGH